MYDDSGDFGWVRERLAALVATPSVWADPRHRQHTHDSAHQIAAMFADAGADVSEVVSAGGAPAVLSHFRGPAGAPTVLFYAHHDVQPAGDLAEWDTDPFVLTERDGRWYGRGAADDKVAVVAHLAAIRSFDGRPPVNVIVLVDGEEESGSPTLAALVARHRQALTADVIVVADSINITPGEPTLTTSLRGELICDVTVGTLRQPVHSGLYGGLAPDALTTLCALLASLRDPFGRVAVTGLHPVAPGFDHAALDSTALLAHAGLHPGVRPLGKGSIAHRLWYSPAVAVLGIDCPPATGAHDVLSATATARISLRTAPGTSAEDAFQALRQHLLSHNNFNAVLTIDRIEECEAYRAPHGTAAVVAVEKALRRGYRTPTLHRVGVGASLPVATLFTEAFPDAELVITGVEDPRSNAHGPNESIAAADVDNICRSEMLMLHHLADLRS